VLFNKIDDMDVTQLMDYLFLTAIQRRPNDTESEHLQGMYNELGFLDDEFDYRFARSSKIDDLAQLTFDYLSRLPEGYYMRRLQ